jgi:hypothetical protein
MDSSQNFDTTTVLPLTVSAGVGPFLANNARSAVTDSGTSFWLGGDGTPTSNGGVWFSTGPVQILNGPTKVRVCQIYSTDGTSANSQLYCTASSAGFANVFTVGTGLPTTAPQTATALSGLPTTSGPSPFSFVFLNLATENPEVNPDTLYITDESKPAGTAAAGMTCAGGGIQKWTRADNVSPWVCIGTIQTSHTTPSVPTGAFAGVRGLTASVAGDGTITLIATTAPTGSGNPPNAIISCTDQRATVPGASGGCITLSATALATGSTTIASSLYRGAALAPLP